MQCVCLTIVCGGMFPFTRQFNSLCTVALVSRRAFTADGYDVKIVTPVYGHLPGHVVYIQGEREMA